MRRLAGGGVEFTKHLVHTADGNRCVLIERLRPTATSIRWEIEIRSQGKPWSTAIETCLQYPATRTTRFWTAWSDSGLAVPGGTYEGTGAAWSGDFGATQAFHYPGWTDPLCPMPLRNTKYYYGAAYYSPAHPDICITPSRSDLFCIPLATFVEPSDDTGLTVALSPDDKLPELTHDDRRRGLAGVFADLSSHRREPAGLFRPGPGGPRRRLARRDAVDGRSLSRVLRSAAAAGRSDGRLRGLLGRRAALRHHAAAPHGLSLELEVQRGFSLPGHVPAHRRRPHPMDALAPRAAGRGQGAAGLVRHDERLRPMDAQRRASTC